MTVDRPRHGPATACGTGALMVPGNARVLLKRSRLVAARTRVCRPGRRGTVRRPRAPRPGCGPGPAASDQPAGPRPGYYYQLLSGLAWTSLPQLPRLQAPTLILAGDDDPIIPLVNARIMHRLIPNSALDVYPAATSSLPTWRPSTPSRAPRPCRR